ncbi:MAG: YceI family protein [Gammaproteobacteria bacterium]
MSIVFFAAPAATAAPSVWHALPGAGRLDFTAYWQGTPVKGQFKRFSVSASLDPAHPAGGTIEVRIATTDIATQSADIARALRSAEWFDAGRYPDAAFTSSTIAVTAHGTLQVRGTLHLKGHEKIITFPLSVKRAGVKLRLAGTFQLDRGDFGIGSGRWAGGEVIATRVAVTFSVLLVPGQ